MIGMQNQRNIEGSFDDWIWFLSLKRIQKVKGNPMARNRFDWLMAFPESLMGGNQQGHAQGQTLGLAQTSVKGGIPAVRVPVAKR